MQTDSINGADKIGMEAQAENPRSPGKMLRASRKQRGLSKKEVADTLHITAHYVNALEHDQYDKLPGEIFAKGYLKRYAEIMGLDQEEILAAYKDVRASDTESASAAQAARSRSRNNRNKLWVGGSLLLFAGLFTGLWLWNKQSVTVDIASSSATSVDGENPATVSGRGAGNVPVAEALGSAPAAELVVQNNAPSTAEAAAENDVENDAADTAEDETLNVADPSDVSELQQTAELQAEGQPQTLLDADPDAQIDNPIPPDDVVAADAQILQTEAPMVTSSQPVVPDLGVQQTDAPPDNVISVPGQGTDTLRISFSGASWVEVNDGEENQIYRDLRVAGDVLEITGSAPFSILLGDALLTRLTFNGNEINVSDNIRIDNSARLTVGL